MEGKKVKRAKTKAKNEEENTNIFLFEIEDLIFPKKEKLSFHHDLFLSASLSHKNATTQKVSSKTIRIMVTALKFLYKGRKFQKISVNHSIFFPQERNRAIKDMRRMAHFSLFFQKIIPRKNKKHTIAPIYTGPDVPG